MHLAAELLLPETRFVEPAGCNAGKIFSDGVGEPKERKAFEGEDDFTARLVLDALEALEVSLECAPADNERRISS